MSYIISKDQNIDIKLIPDTVQEEVLQNVFVILSTIKGECPLERDIGISLEMIDRPVETAKAICIESIYENIEKYEPRADVVSISYEENEGDKLIPIVEVEIRNEYIRGEFDE